MNKQGELDGEPAVAKKNYTSRQSIDEERSSNCTEAGYERDAQEMEKTSQASPPTVLERILPPFPASRRELYLHIQGFSGLTRPLNARGSPILAKVFWGRQEVSETLDRRPFETALRVMFVGRQDTGTDWEGWILSFD